MAKKKTEETGDYHEHWCCCGSHHGKKPLFIGILLLVIGAAWANKYSMPEILMLVGGILIVKGLLIMLFRKDK